VQVPAVVDAVYVAVTFPFASVTPGFGLMVPQAPETDGESVNWTGSLIAATAPFFTFAVIVAVVAPSAGTLALFDVTVTVNATAGGGFEVWVSVVLALPPDASDAVMLQNPTVVLAV